jgi:O-methyltransferase involved in polyketide biosynthesis
MMSTEKTSLAQEKETLLITLYAKAGESHLPDSLLRDNFAAQAVSRLDYDFAKLKVTHDLMIGVAMRAHIFDGWTRDFLARHPDASVLHLGCGLDARVFRIDPPSSVRWFEVDYPEVIDLHRRIYPARDNCSLIGACVTDSDWLAAVPPEHPTLIIAEGLMPYLQKDAVPRLLAVLAEYFSHGELAFDAYNEFGLWMLKYNPSIQATGACLHWSMEDPHDLEDMIPKLTLLDDIKAYDPEGYDPQQVARMSWPARITIDIFRGIPSLGKMGRLLRYRF